MTKFVYDGAERLVDTTAGGTIQARYLFGPGLDELLEFKRGTTTRYALLDGLGSIVALTDATGAITERISYSPFGSSTITNASGTVVSSSPGQSPFLFTGRELEPELGIYHYRKRDYDFRLGRFVQRDPLGYIGDINLYRYVFNRPTVWTDPFGLAYFGKRPLKNWPFFMVNDPVDDALNTEISHEHLFFEDGQEPSNRGFGPDGVFTEPEKERDNYQRTSGHYDDTLMREAVKRAETNDYCTLGNNCQSWAERVRTEYKGLEHKQREQERKK